MFVFVLALAEVLLATPVMGAPATKVESVTATVLGISTEGVSRMVDHGIIQVRGGILSGDVILTIPGQVPMAGTIYSELNGWVKLEHPAPGPWLEAEGLFSGKVELSFPEGTFVGIRHYKSLGFPPPVMSYMETHMVFQGTGIFKGQTLKLSFEGDPPIPAPITFEGYLIMPK